MKIPSKCPLCGVDKLMSETGIEHTRYFVNGKKVEEQTVSLPRRLICMNCWTFLTDTRKCSKCGTVYVVTVNDDVCGNCEIKELGFIVKDKRKGRDITKEEKAK